MAFHSHEAGVMTMPRIGLATLISFCISVSGIIGTYSVLQHRVSATESQLVALSAKMEPLATDVAVVKTQVQMTSETVQRIERKLDK